MNKIFGVSLSGLYAAQAGIATTSHNIANANTPGYTRQVVLQGAKPAQFTGAGFFGQGTDVVAVQRVYSEFLAQQVVSAQSKQSEIDAHLTQIKQLDDLLGNSGTGLTSALNDFFKGVNNVANNPADSATRLSFLSDAQALAGRFQSLYNRIGEIRQGVNSQITSSVDLVNGYARQIASLNQAIEMAEASSGGSPANDLRDQRDQLVLQLNQEIKATVVAQSNGTINVFIGNGQALVTGGNAGRLLAVASSTDPNKLELAFTAGGNSVLIRSDSLQSGKLQGLINFGSEALAQGENALGRIAMVLAENFNATHRLGQDLNGNLGGDFLRVAKPFAYASALNTGTAQLDVSVTAADQLTASDYRLQYDGSGYQLTRMRDGSVLSFASLPQVIDGISIDIASGTPSAGDEFLLRPTANGARDIGVLTTDLTRIAAASPVRTSAALSNLGNARISAGDVSSSPANPNLQQPVTITFTSPTTFNVTGVGTGNPIGLTYTPGASISFNGWTLTIDGSAATGDTFSVGPNSTGVSDNRNALKLAGLQTQNLIAGRSTLQGAYGELLSGVGSKTRELQVSSTAQTGLVSMARQAHQGISGVNLDEEAANLLRYQQAYHAAAKAMQIAGSLLDTLMELGR